MKVYPDDRIAQWALSQAQKKMTDRRREGIHISDLTACHRKAILARRYPDLQYPPADILRFAQGYAIQEFFLGPEEEGKEYLSVLCSADRAMEDSILEFKHTRKSYRRQRDGYEFNPEEHPEWILRTACYCLCYGKRKAHILVFFKYADELHSWTVEYSEDDLQQAKELIISQRDKLLSSLESGRLPPREETWQCEYCLYKVKCLEEENGG